MKLLRNFALLMMTVSMVLNFYFIFMMQISGVAVPEVTAISNVIYVTAFTIIVTILAGQSND